jgi:hypothetical protein
MVFTVLIPLMYLPACFIVYNGSALGYFPIYVLFNVLGQGIGLLKRRRIPKK